MLASITEAELDRGPAAGGERFCALERKSKPVDELTRFVVGPGNEVVPDVKRKLPGRGIWITATRDAVDEAVKRRVFSRGFRKDVCAPADLAATTERLLEQAALDALAIVAKAGQVVAGFGKVEDAILNGKVVALVQAADGAPDGKRKLAAALRRNKDDRTEEIALIDAFSTQQLDLALNRVNVIHAALLDGPVTATFVTRTRRFSRFRGDISAARNDVSKTEELRTE